MSLDVIRTTGATIDDTTCCSARGMKIAVSRPLICVSLITNVYATMLCECGPRRYNFRLNFTGVCDAPALVNDPSKGYFPYLCGIDHYGCDDSQVPNCKAPVNITELYVMEHKSHELEIIYGGFLQKTFSEPLYDGDIFEYTSITSMTTYEMVRRVTLQLVGYNVYGNKVNFVLSWKYTNECDVNPIEPNIEPWAVGWIYATNDTLQADPSTCQYPSSSPSQTPTLSRPPSKIPSGNPSSIPTDLPTVVPSTGPTRSKIHDKSFLSSYVHIALNHSF